jgi:hypothetical protein
MNCSALVYMKFNIEFELSKCYYMKYSGRHSRNIRLMITAKVCHCNIVNTCTINPVNVGFPNI